MHHLVPNPRRRRRLSQAVAAISLTAALGLVAAAPSSADAPLVDVSGDWTVTTGGSFTEHYDMAADGSVTGTLVDNGATIQGHVSGYVFTWTDHYSSGYSSTVTVNVSADDTTFAGTFTDTNGASGSISGVRQGSAPTSARAGAIQVNCDRDVATQVFTCTAQVADASGQSPAKVPTGTVAFALKSGGEGTFPAGATCTLQPSQTGGASAFCSVRYVEGSHHIPTGEQPAITASYSGDANFKPTTGEPKNEYVAPPDDADTTTTDPCSATTRVFAIPIFSLRAETCPVPLGTVSGVKGAVYKKDAAGNVTRLTDGSPIREGDHIITEGENSQVDVHYTLGDGVSIPSNKEIMFTGGSATDVNPSNSILQAAKDSFGLYKAFHNGTGTVHLQWSRGVSGIRG